MRKCIFLYYGWFLQNLEKGCIRTNMHTTVNKVSECRHTYLDHVDRIPTNIKKVVCQAGLFSTAERLSHNIKQKSASFKVVRGHMMFKVSIQEVKC